MKGIDLIREALEGEYQHLLGAWQMATGPLTKADVDMRINRNRDALTSLKSLEGRLTVDALANEIRSVDGNNSLGAGALAEALMPFLTKSANP